MKASQDPNQGKKSKRSFVIIALVISLGIVIFILMPQITTILEPKDEYVDSNTIEWSKDILEWKDFQGKPDETITGTAATNSAIDYQIEVTGTSLNSEECIYKIPDINATAVFSKTNSWVKQEGKTDLNLKHEQGHFDIKEIQARLIEKESIDEFEGKLFPCPQINGETSVQMINQEGYDRILALVDELKEKDFIKMAEAYESETKHGTNHEKQLEWNQKIKNLLEETEYIRTLISDN